MPVSDIRAEVRRGHQSACTAVSVNWELETELDWVFWKRRAGCAPNHWTIKNVNLMCVTKTFHATQCEGLRTTVESDLSLHIHVCSGALTRVSRLALPTWAVYLTPPTLNPNLGPCGQFSSVVEWLQFPAPHTQKPEDRTTCPLPQTPILEAKLTMMSSHAQVSFSQIC